MYNSTKKKSRPTDSQIKKPKSSNLSSLKDNSIDVIDMPDEKRFEIPVILSRYNPDAYNFTLEDSKRGSSNRETSMLQGNLDFKDFNHLFFEPR